MAFHITIGYSITNTCIINSELNFNFIIAIIYFSFEYFW